MRDKIVKKCEKSIIFAIGLMIITLPFSKALVELSIAVAFFAWILKKALTKDWSLTRTSLKWPFLLFIIAGALSFINTSYLYISFRGLLKIVKYATLYFIIIETVNSEKKFRNFIYLTLATSFIIGLDGMFQYFTGIDLIRRFELSGGRVRASFGNINDFGSYLIIVLSLAVSTLAWGVTRLKEKIALGGLVGLLGTCLALTYSRGSLAAGLVAIVFQGFFKIKKILPIFLILVILGTLFLPKAVFERAKSAFLLKQTSYNERFDVWRGAFNMVKAHPIVGNGINTFFRDYPKYRIDDREDSGHAHNCYLQMLAETGILGLITFLYLIAVFFIKVIAYIRRNLNNLDFYSASVLGLTAGLFGFLLQSFIDTNLYSLPLAVLFWSTVGFVMSIVEKDKG